MRNRGEPTTLQKMHIAFSDHPSAPCSLNVVLAPAYPIRSTDATRFRIWATERLREYLIKGFTMDDAKFKELGGGHKELADGATVAQFATVRSMRLSQQRLAGLFQISRANVTENIGNVLDEGELEEAATCRDSRQVRAEGARSVERPSLQCNLDVIITTALLVTFLARNGILMDADDQPRISTTPWLRSPFWWR